MAAELVELLATAGAAPLEARHAAEAAALEERVKMAGERGSGRKDLATRQRRELRRLRTDELRFGLATLAALYRDALVDERVEATACLDALDALQKASEALTYNPSETLFLQALLLRLPPFRPARVARPG